MNNTSLPISTQWLLESSDKTNVKVINAVYLIYCQKTGSKGTGFLLKNDYIITNWHVIKNCNANEIIAISSNGEQVYFSELIYDSNKDLAAIKPVKTPVVDGLEIDGVSVETETKVCTWGHPLAYSGPSPILSVGYLAGFRDHRETVSSPIVKRYIINGAFNPGNSGGPLFVSGNQAVVGVVVAKHAPISRFLLSALEVLSNNRSGVLFTGRDERGNNIEFVESQIVAMLLEHQRTMTQVMIGEAIVSSELVEFLKEKNI